MSPSPTERLFLRRATTNDAPYLLRLLNSKGWLANIGDRGVHTLDDATKYLTEKILPAYQNPGCGPMLCVLKAYGTIIGQTGVYVRPGLESPDFGFAFLEAYHGQGYAYEASVSNLAYAEAQGVNKLLAITLPNNTPSLRLLDKLGFIREPKLVSLPGDDKSFVLLRREAQQEPVS